MSRIKEAFILGVAVLGLAYSFTQVAQEKSEDTSKTNGGDVGIMTNNATSGSLGMVNEFQLGIYAFDNLYDTANAADAAAGEIKAGLGITDDVAAALPANVTEIPYEAFVKLDQFAEVTADKEGHKLANGSERVYPRNIIWNKYLNLHNVFVIKNAKCGAAAFNSADPAAEFVNLVSDEAYDATMTARFNDKGWLVDENGNVVIGVRSQYGIHFMIIEKSMYDYATLADYYTTYIPTDDKYPKDANGKPSKDTYVAYVQTLGNDEYKTRANDIKSKIKSFDATYDYRLFQELQKDVTITYEGNAKDLGALIEANILKTRENNSWKQKDGLSKVWRTYTELLGAQTKDRSATYDTNNSFDGNPSPLLTRLVSEKIADDFFKLYDDPVTNKDLYKEFKEGGMYYFYA